MIEAGTKVRMPVKVKAVEGDERVVEFRTTCGTYSGTVPATSLWTASWLLVDVVTVSGETAVVELPGTWCMPRHVVPLSLLKPIVGA